MREWLVERRKKEKLTQLEISKLVGISLSHYCLIENDKRNPSIFVAQKIAQVLKINWLNFIKPKEE